MLIAYTTHRRGERSIGPRQSDVPRAHGWFHVPSACSLPTDFWSTVSAKSVCNLTSNCSPSSSLLFVINRKFPIAAPLPCICLLVGAFVKSGVCIYVCVFTLLDRSLKFEPMRVLFLPVTVLYWTLERELLRGTERMRVRMFTCAPRVYLLRNARRVSPCLSIAAIAVVDALVWRWRSFSSVLENDYHGIFVFWGVKLANQLLLYYRWEREEKKKKKKKTEHTYAFKIMYKSLVWYISTLILLTVVMKSKVTIPRCGL